MSEFMLKVPEKSAVRSSLQIGITPSSPSLTGSFGLNQRKLGDFSGCGPKPGGSHSPVIRARPFSIHGLLKLDKDGGSG
jgi:hypothetical protein